MNNEQRNIIRNAVKKYVNDNYSILPTLTHEELEHVVDTGTTIMAVKWDIEDSYGSFVKAIVNDKLTDSFGSADGANLKAIRFYVMMKYNMGIPRGLYSMNDTHSSI